MHACSAMHAVAASLLHTGLVLVLYTDVSNHKLLICWVIIRAAAQVACWQPTIVW
jgi:hypothetical protein